MSFEKMKARDLDPTIKKGFVVEADVWGEHWWDLQNTYFEEKGYDLRVDPIAILAQEHLGPVRMRHHMNDEIARSQLLQKANEFLLKPLKKEWKEDPSVRNSKKFMSSVLNPVRIFPSFKAERAWAKAMC